MLLSIWQDFTTRIQGFPLWFQIVLLLITAGAVWRAYRHSLALREYAIVQERCKRLEETCSAQQGEIDRLKALTNLEPMIEAFKTFQLDFQSWKTEARGQYTGALTRLEELRSENIRAMTTAQKVLDRILDKLLQ